MTEKKFKVTMEITISGRLVGEEVDCNFVENAIGENLRSTNSADFNIETQDIWAKEIYEEEEK